MSEQSLEFMVEVQIKDGGGVVISHQALKVPGGDVPFVCVGNARYVKVIGGQHLKVDKRTHRIEFEDETEDEVTIRLYPK